MFQGSGYDYSKFKYYGLIVCCLTMGEYNCHRTGCLIHRVKIQYLVAPGKEKKIFLRKGESVVFKNPSSQITE